MSDITRDYSFGGWLRSFRLNREHGVDIVSEWSEPEAPKFKRKAWISNDGHLCFSDNQEHYNSCLESEYERAEWLDEP